MRLDDEDVRATDRFVEATMNLSVGELTKIRLGQFHPELVGDVLRESGMAASRDDDETTLRQ